GLDDARALVAEDDRRRERNRAVDHRDVAVAQPGVVDAHPDLVRARVAHLDVVPHLQLAGPDDALHGRLPLPLAVLTPATRSTAARCRRAGRSCPGRARRPTA